MEKELIKSIKKEIASNNKLLKSGKLSVIDERCYKDANFQLRLDLEEYQSRASSYKNSMDHLFSLMDKQEEDDEEKYLRRENTILKDSYKITSDKRWKNNNPGYLTSLEATKFLGICIETLSRYRRQGKIKAHLLNGSSRLYHKIDELKKFKATLKPFKNAKKKE